MAGFARSLDVTLRALTRTTERGARRHGVGRYLPSLFADRFALMGGIDPAVLAAQLDGCRTFEDAGWAAYWGRLADEQIAVVDAALAAADAPLLAELLAQDETAAAQTLGGVLAASPDLLATIDGAGSDRPGSPEVAALVRAITYLFAAAWPGLTPHRLEAYRRSRALLDLVLRALAPLLDVEVETLIVHAVVDGRLEQVSAVAVLPRSEAPLPAVLVTNGLEGTVQELLLPLIGYRDRGMAVVCMEMPGTYLHSQPLTPSSTAVYTAVLDRLVAHPRIDASRVGMVGFSFGAVWSTRMAATDARLRATVSNGGLYHRSLRPTAAWGLPQIMLEALEHTTGAAHPAAMARRLRALSVRHLYSSVATPLLVINGEDDTLASTRDSVELAHAAPRGELLLYPDDDHCAMGHYRAWLDHTIAWLAEHLDATPR